MCFPRIKIDTAKISHNARLLNDRCAARGISVVGVTKCILAHKSITPLLTDAGIEMLADSRLDNIRRLFKLKGDPSKIMMLRSPMHGEIEELINICGTSLNTQPDTVELIARACDNYKKDHDIIIMVEVDDEREGLLPEKVKDFCSQIMGKSRYLHIRGIGTNARCITSKGPTRESLDILVSLKKELEDKMGLKIDILSGGNSSIWNMIESKVLPPEVNQVRIGEAIFFGHETAGYKAIEGMHRGCFTLEAEIIEIKARNGIPCRLILALGLQDAALENLSAAHSNLMPVNQSSDHTVLDIAGSTAQKDFSNYKVGGIISFNLNYFSLLSCMTSPFVHKELI